MKLVVNTLLAFEIEAVAEVSALADRLGIPPGELVDAVSGGPLASGTALAKLARMQSGDYSTDFSLEWALKDLDRATAAADSVATPVAGAIAERWRALVAQGHGRLDISAARLGLDGRTKQDSVDPLGTKDRAPAEVRP
jgi:3-hydroxyisobutyrate dehydrogenase-like beta-hydroxyacid dehydrogenase